MPIVTQRNRIPWSWAVCLGLPWASAVYADMISGQPLTFTLRRFVSDPAFISLILSFNVLFNFLVGVVSNYVSDRIWTRWGRRRPFVIIGSLGAATMLVFVPLAPNLPTLVACIIAYQFFVDVGRPWEALFNEIVPPAQRGRAGTFRMLLTNIGAMFFGSVLIRQWDGRYLVDGVGVVTGEHVVYWFAALMMFGAALFFTFCIRETPPAERVAPAPRGPILVELRTALRDIFGSAQAWGVHLLYLCPVLAGAGGGAMTTLFITEQLGKSKAEMGTINFWVMPPIILLFTPIGGYLADRFDRVRLLQLGILVPAVFNLGFVYYVRTVADFDVSVATLIGAALAASFFQGWVGAVWGPVLFDYIPPDRMGTFMAGFTMTSGLVGFGLTNLNGLWVKGWTALAGNPGPGDYDYSSVYVFIFLCALVSLGGTLVFQRLVRRGVVKPLGRVERPA